MNPQEQRFLKESVAESFSLAIEQSYGKEGFDVFKILLEDLTDCCKYIEPIDLKKFVVFRFIDSGRNLPKSFPKPTILQNREHLITFANCNRLLIQILNNGYVAVWKNVPNNFLSLRKSAVIYSYENREEFIHTKNSKVKLKPFPGTASYFSVPAYKNLSGTLEDYQLRYAQTCRILQEAWDDEKRIFWKKRPEEYMKRSLHQHINVSLRSPHEATVEYVTDDTKPVDIKITWDTAPRIALIEVKWLGKSRTSSKKLANHSEGRARQGAKQLAGYLDHHHIRVPTLTKGYLVIFDARRRNTNSKTKNITYKNGLYYKDQEIIYKPEYYNPNVRPMNDFQRPVRIFFEPACNP